MAIEKWRVYQLGAGIHLLQLPVILWKLSVPAQMLGSKHICYHMKEFARTFACCGFVYNVS